MAGSFTHLHVHTHYSLLDGANKIPDLVKRAKALGMDSLAITDHGCMFGVVEFFSECKKEGIKPILGMEAYMAPGDRRDRSGVPGETAYHLLLLAENLEGYRNLLKLSSTAYRDGFYYKPRIDKEVLREHSKGLIATSACLGGEIPSAFMRRGKMAEAKQVAETYLDIFGPDRFYIEVQNHIKEQNEVNPELAELAKKTGVGLVATNDVHFLTKDDHFAHDVLCCISMGKLQSDEGRLKYPTQLYLKSAEEMHEALGNFDQAIENTTRIAGMCDLDLDFGKRYSPVYRVPAEKLDDAVIPPGLPAATLKPIPVNEPIPVMKDDERYLRQLCEQGLVWRYGTRDVPAAVRTRLDYELKIIAAKQFCSYFLIVWDFCNFARDNGIPVGARGSGVGCMVAFLLGLCNVDPITYGLLFERFMDPSRNEMPDIDIDICQDGRPKVIDYVRNKYGHVAQIITFGTLAAKAACKDVGRVLGIPLPEIDRITKLIPSVPGTTLEKAMKRVPELRELYEQNVQTKQVIDLAMKLEGMCRNAGCHAAGVIIADQPLDEIVPLYRDSDGNVLTQFEGPIAEKCGLLKMDFLGLRTLSTLTRSLELEFTTRLHRPTVSGVPRVVPMDDKNQIDLEKIDLTDQTVFAMFQRGETRGIFQFESGGMQDLLMKMVPDRIEDLIAANALYRPGPMELIPTYCNRKHGREPVPQVHPIMDALLAETYGVMVYQEQVMQIFNQLGGIDLSSAYKLIKAISKKNGEIIAKFKPDFLRGTMDKGVDRDKAEEIFDLILKFGGYGFNKSHSTRYAIIAFQTAYMKTYHPVEYMSALLTFEMGSTEKVVEYIEECRRMTLLDGSRGIRVLPPDVNVSDKDFTPVYAETLEKPKGRGKAKAPKVEGTIRFGLAAVRGVGEKAVEAVSAERHAKGDFTSLYDFCERVDLRTVTRSTIEALIKCGAFSSLKAKRSQLLHIADRAVELGQQTQNDRRSGQLSMFGGGGPAAPSVAATMGGTLPDMDEVDNAELLKFEKELLGFYITSHPLTDHQINIERFTTSSTKEAMQLSEGAEVTIGGMIARVKKVVTKNGRSAGMPMAIITLEDLDGSIDGTCFAETFAEIIAKYPDTVKNEQIVFVRGKVDRKRETPSLLVNEVIPVADAVAKLTTAVAIKLDPNRHDAALLSDLPAVLARHKGGTPLYFQINTAAGKATLTIDKQHAIQPTALLLGDVEQLLGPGSIDLAGGDASKRRRRRLEQQRLFKDDALDLSPAAETAAYIGATIDDMAVAELDEVIS